MKYIFYTDLHRYAPNEIETNTKPYNEENVYFLGDIYDLKNCKNKDVEKVQFKINNLKEQYIYVSGNHELCLDYDNIYHVKGNILMTHGDLDRWGLTKAIKFRCKKKGAGFLKRAIVKVLCTLSKLLPVRINDTHLERCLLVLERYSCDTYVAGHVHAKKIIDFKYACKRFVFLPRGRTEIEL